MTSSRRPAPRSPRPSTLPSARLTQGRQPKRREARQAQRRRIRLAHGRRPLTLRLATLAIRSSRDHRQRPERAGNSWRWCWSAERAGRSGRRRRPICGGGPIRAPSILAGTPSARINLPLAALIGCHAPALWRTVARACVLTPSRARVEATSLPRTWVRWAARLGGVATAALLRQSGPAASVGTTRLAQPRRRAHRYQWRSRPHSLETFGRREAGVRGELLEDRS